MNTQNSHNAALAKGIAFLGECMIEISGTLPSPLKLGFAGDTLNTAAYLSRLVNEQGGAVSFITGLGTDMLSRSMLQFLQECGVGASHIRTDKKRRPGLYLIETTSSGERVFHYWRGEAAARYFLDNTDPGDFTEELCGFGGLYLSGISIAVLTDKGKRLLFEALCAAKEKGLKIYFDSNYRATLWRDREQAQKTFERFAPLADIAMMTDGDLAELYAVGVEEVSRVAEHYHVPELVLKRGHLPCLIRKDESAIEVPACRVERERVVDTTAAGDSFNAAYLAARLLGNSPESAALCGHILAASVIQQHGAIIERGQMPNIPFGEHASCSCPNHRQLQLERCK